MKNQTACFTGHREIPFFQKRRLKAKVKSAITDAIRNGYRYFGAGGALGFDMLAAQTVLELKADYPDIKLILVLPCLNQTRGWAQEDVKEYERIKAAADKVTYISKEYYNGCMHKRNRHLVDSSSLCICYLTKQSGGTAYTVSYAESHDLKIVNVAQ
ncbi:MAG: DUF1273 family protein [Clostridia bacterium]|nr:DUF1273 family protein [Clostridia bacterium]